VPAYICRWLHDDFPVYSFLRKSAVYAKTPKGVSFPSTVDGYKSSFRNVVFWLFRIPDNAKVHKASILSVIHLRENHLESIWVTSFKIFVRFSFIVHCLWCFSKYICLSLPLDEHAFLQAYPCTRLKPDVSVYKSLYALNSSPIVVT
jgi:hypothetical protein